MTESFSPVLAREELLVGGDGKAEWTLDHAPGFYQYIILVPNNAI